MADRLATREVTVLTGTDGARPRAVATAGSSPYAPTTGDARRRRRGRARSTRGGCPRWRRTSRGRCRRSRPSSPRRPGRRRARPPARGGAARRPAARRTHRRPRARRRHAWTVLGRGRLAEDVLTAPGPRTGSTSARRSSPGSTARPRDLVERVGRLAATACSGRAARRPAPGSARVRRSPVCTPPARTPPPAPGCRSRALAALVAEVDRPGLSRRGSSQRSSPDHGDRRGHAGLTRREAAAESRIIAIFGIGDGLRPRRPRRWSGTAPSGRAPTPSGPGARRALACVGERGLARAWPSATVVLGSASTADAVDHAARRRPRAPARKLRAGAREVGAADREAVAGLVAVARVPRGRATATR